MAVLWLDSNTDLTGVSTRRDKLDHPDGFQNLGGFHLKAGQNIPLLKAAPVKRQTMIDAIWVIDLVSAFDPEARAAGPVRCSAGTRSAFITPVVSRRSTTQGECRTMSNASCKRSGNGANTLPFVQ